MPGMQPRLMHVVKSFKAVHAPARVQSSQYSQLRTSQATNSVSCQPWRRNGAEAHLAVSPNNGVKDKSSYTHLCVSQHLAILVSLFTLHMHL